MSQTASRRGHRLAAALALATLLAVGACKRDDNQLPDVQRGEDKAAVAAEPAVQGFGLARAWPDKHDGDLALALEFSRPVVGTQSFDELITVTGAKGEAVKGSWALDDDGKTLRFPFVEASRNYTVRIKGVLAAAEGGTLGKDLTQQVYTGPLEPAVGFASQGSVLPARESRGLPVVSVNVKEVDVEFLRVRDTELSNFFANYQRGGRRGSWELDNDWGDKAPLTKLADPVYLNRFVLGGGENERLLTYLPVQNIPDLQQPGLYFAVMKAAGRFEDEKETAFFFVSDIGLHVRAYKDKLFVHAASLNSGEALNGVALEILDERGQAVVQAATDANGNALIGYALQAAHVLVAKQGKDVSVQPFNQPALDLSEFAVAGRAQAWFDVFAWSGRDLYRPGETVRVSALLRDYDGKPVKAQSVFLTLKQPDGKTFLQSELKPRELGYFEFERAIPADAPTGRWQLEFRTDPASKDAVEGMSLRIEEFLPERMKLDLESKQKTLKPGEPLKLEAVAAYLYGAPAAGNRFTARLALSADTHPIEALKDYHFGDPTLELPKEAADVIDAKFDAKGRFTQDLKLPDEANVKAPVAAIVSGSVYETGGRTVTRTLKRTVWPADALVGVRPLFDDDDGAPANGSAGFELLRANADGARVAAGGLKVSLVRERRDYHWAHGDDGWSFDYSSRFETVETKTIDAPADGSARVDFPVEWGDYRLEVTDPATGLISRYPFTAGWSWDDENRGLDARPDKAKLALDKERYRAGDTLKVTVTPPHPGPGVLLVESDKLLYVTGIEAKPGATYEIPVTPDWERHDVYVTALVFRGGSAAQKVTPARAVGVAHVPMDRTERRVEVTIASPKLTKPGQPLPVTVKAPALAGKPAFVTVSAVDVGILNITRFPVPDAYGYFFAQRRLGVDSYDLYGRVIESFEGEIARLRFGGDAMLAALPQARRPTARVQTVDLFAGPVKLDAKGGARVPVNVPDFNGTLRVSALVFGEDRYGSADTESVIRAPVVAEVSAPRVLAPGDRGALTLDLQNFTGAAQEFAVEVTAESPLAVGEAQRTVKLADGAKTTLNFPLTALEGYGVGRFKVSAKAGAFAVERSYEIPVRAAWPAVLRAQSRTLDPPARLTLDAALAEGLLPGSVNARFTVSALPPLPFASALGGALAYPYGCTEQTVSKGYAALILDAATAKNLGIGGLTPERRSARLEGAMGRLTSMQIGSGHFSMWGGDSEANPLLTPYVVEFMLDARDDGVAVPETVLQKALERLSEDLLSGGQPFYDYEHADHLRFASQAYSGYVLARVNRAPLGTLRALYDGERSKSLTALPLVHLGLALHLQGDKARGAKAIAEAFRKTVKRPWYLGDYGSDLRDTALMIALLHKHALSRPDYDARVIALGREVDTERRERDAAAARYPAAGRWAYLSTQEQVAIARLGQALIADGGRTVTGTLETAPGSGSGAGAASERVEGSRVFGRSFGYEALAQGVRFTPEASESDKGGPLYASIEIAGVPRAAPAADETRIAVKRSLYTVDGKPWKPAPLKEGEALIVGLKIDAREKVPDALVTDLLPAGLEIENFNLTDAKQWADVVVDGISLTERANAANLKHEEFRDDRYVAALDLDKGQTAHVFYLVRAVTPGTYTVPPPLVEDMYRPQIRGIGKHTPETIEVVQP